MKCDEIIELNLFYHYCYMYHATVSDENEFPRTGAADLEPDSSIQSLVRTYVVDNLLDKLALDENVSYQLRLDCCGRNKATNIQLNITINVFPKQILKYFPECFNNLNFNKILEKEPELI